MLILGVTSCKKDDSPTSTGGSSGFTSSFSNNAVTINPGSQSAAKLSGGTPPYSITTPPNASVATASISNDSVFITAVAAGTTSMTISDASPTAGDNPNARTLTININVPSGGTMNVSGFVKDYANVPIAGAAVVIPGKAPVTSGSDGSFTISGVTSPYDATFIVSSAKTAVTFKSLTRQDPVLLFPFGTFGQSNSATISGTVPAASGKTTRVFFVSGEKSWGTTASQTTGSYTINASWSENVTTYAGMIYVLRYTVANGLPAVYDGFGSSSLTISTGGTFTGNNFATGQLSDPADLNISGSVSRPSSNYTLATRSLYILFGNSVTFLGSEGGTLSDNLSYTVPQIAGVTFAIFAAATYNGRITYYFRTGITGGSTTVSVPLAEAPQLSLPVNGGTNVDTTTSFLFTQGGGTGVNIISVTPSSSSDPRFYIFSTGNSFSIPNLASQGLGIPSNRSYTWNVLKVSPFASINDAANGTLQSLLSGNIGDFGQAYSEQFGFTSR